MSDTNPLARISKIMSTYEISGKEPIKDNIIFDSGASVSVVSQDKLLDDMVDDDSMSFITAGGKVLQSSAKGKLSLYVKNNCIIQIKEVYYITNLQVNLISLGDLTKMGHRAIFEGESLFLEKDNSKHLIAELDPETRLYIGIHGVVPSSVETGDKNNFVENETRKNLEGGIFAVKHLVDLKFPQYIANNNDKKDLFYYHLQTNHMSLRALEHLIDQGKISAKKKNLEARKKVLNCTHCKAVNSKKISHNRSSQRVAIRRLQRIHLDTLGPFRVNGLKYYITTLIDEYSGFMICVISDTRSIQLSLLRELKIMNNQFPGEFVANFRSDNARELPDRQLLLELGIRKEEIPAYTPAMNGRAETYNKFILKQLKLVVLNFPNRLFDLLSLFNEIIAYCVYVINHTPSRRVDDHLGESPFELFYGYKYQANFRQFGIDVLVHINNPIEASSLGVESHKALPAVVKGFLVGYGQDSNTYLVKVMHGNRPIRVFANVTFLNSMDSIEEYFKLVDNGLREQSREIADTLAKLDVHGNRSTDSEIPVNDLGPTHDISDPNPEDIPSFQDIFDREMGITTIQDLFDMESNAVIGVHNTDPNLQTYQDSNGVISHHTMLVTFPSCYEERISSPSWSRNLQEVSCDLEPRTVSALGLSELARKDMIHNPNGGDTEPVRTIKDNKAVHSLLLKLSRRKTTESSKLELGHGGHTLLSESLHPYPVDEGHLGLPLKEKCAPKIGKELLKELSKVPRVLENLNKIINGLDKKSSYPRNDLTDTWIFHLGTVNDKFQSSLGEGSRVYGRLSDPPKLFNISTAKEFICPNQNNIQLQTPYESIDNNNSIYSVENYVDMDDPNWKAAMNDEMNKFSEMNVFDIVDIPMNEKLIPARWVHTYKVDDQKGANYKSRCVVQGFRQISGVNFDPSRVLSPVTDLTSIKILTVIATELNYEVHHVDIKSAYLNSELPDGIPIYIRPPKGVVIEKGKCWRLNKAVYGLKQAAYEWFIHISAKFKELGIMSSDEHEGIFLRRDGDNVIYIALYVDDLFIVASSNKYFNEFLKTLEGVFRLNYLGPVKEYLGVEFERTENGYNLSQKKFIKNILEAFELTQCTAKSLPRPPSDTTTFHNQTRNEKDHLQIEDTPKVLTGKDLKVYQKGVGMLQWLCMNTRPDISFATNALGIKASAPTKEDYKMLLHCIKYLKGTLDLGLKYTKGKTKDYGDEFVIYGFADASFAPPGNRKSISGYAIYINGNLVYWGTKKQRCITESSMSSEIIALGECTHRIMTVKSVIKALGLSHRKFIIFEDNEPCIKVAKNRKISHSRRTVDICMKHIRELVLQKGELGISYINTVDNVADILTKAAGMQVFHKLRPWLMTDANLLLLHKDLMINYIGRNNPEKHFLQLCQSINLEPLDL